MHRTAACSVAVVLLGLTACTSGGMTSAPTTRVTTTTTVPAPSGSPVAAGPTTARAAARCPYVSQGFVHTTMGLRLGRITVLRSGATIVGCRFYALQGGSLHRIEHLPGPDQPAVEITTRRWSSALAAHNAFVLRARRGTNPAQVTLGSGVLGVCFQNDFYPHDRGQDWACSTSVGATELLVRSVDTTSTYNTAAVTRAVLRAL